MTNKEVKEYILANWFDGDENVNAVVGDCEETLAMKCAVKALEKQITRKPYNVDEECKTFDCPACLSNLYTDDDVRDCGYCCVCGQALDWDENNA